MVKDIHTTKSEILIKQTLEMSYKGSLNRDLYLVGYASNGQVVSKNFWKNNNVTTYNEFVDSCSVHPAIVKATVSNKYDDWVVDIYIQ